MKKAVLKNGLTVLLEPVKDTKSATVLVLVRVGSRYETQSVNGVSHFLEHLLFKGTQRRPTTLHISRELDRIGAQYNAFTSKDYTAYYVKASSEYVSLSIDLISDMVQHSVFDAKELDRERTVVVEELNMYEDNPIMRVEEVTEETLYGKTTPLGQVIGGPRSVIRRIPRQKIVDFWSQYYQPGNMAVVVAGKIDVKKTMHWIQKSFGTMKRRSAREQFLKQPAVKGGIKTSLIHRETEQTQMGMSFSGVGYRHPDVPVLSVLNVILGGSMSSRLFVEIREKRGLAYAVKSEVSLYEGQGHLWIQGGLDPRRMIEAVEAVIAELHRFKMEKVTDDELRDAKTHIKGKMDLVFEDSEVRANWYGMQEILLQQWETPEQRWKKIQAVRVQDIQRVAKKIFTKRAPALALLGNHSTHEMPRLKKILQKL